MKDTAIKIKSLRKQKHFSQEELAERSGLALRTVQRIENGETEPRGDTLMRLAAALDVAVDEIVDLGAVEDNRYVAMMNLSALGCLVSGVVFNILLPLILWLARKGKVRGLDDAAKKLLNFQITWSIAVLLWIISFLAHEYSALLAAISSAMDASAPLGENVTVMQMLGGALTDFQLKMLILLAALYAVNIALIAVNTLRLRKGKKAVYPPTIPILQ